MNRQRRTRPTLEETVGHRQLGWKPGSERRCGTLQKRNTAWEDERLAANQPSLLEKSREISKLQQQLAEELGRRKAAQYAVIEKAQLLCELQAQLTEKDRLIDQLKAARQTSAGPGQPGLRGVARQQSGQSQENLADARPMSHTPGREPLILSPSASNPSYQAPQLLNPGSHVHLPDASSARGFALSPRDTVGAPDMSRFISVPSQGGFVQSTSCGSASVPSPPRFNPASSSRAPTSPRLSPRLDGSVRRMVTPSPSVGMRSTMGGTNSVGRILRSPGPHLGCSQDRDTAHHGARRIPSAEVTTTTTATAATLTTARYTQSAGVTSCCCCACCCSCCC
ncbi:unnamed protein product [Polarella glacialis]|uniref:Uncharacterized protein n=1 Tax=Polarella glacialis TaxID=89957 RepID=A0A813LMU1_POLGL|nr:unnamed protein product [Polarella glacialis]